LSFAHEHTLGVRMVHLDYARSHCIQNYEITNKAHLKISSVEYMGEITKVFGLDWRLLIIQAVNFGVLLWVLWYFLYHPIIKMIDERKGKIAKGVHDADKAEKRLTEIEGERVEVLTKASQQAEEILFHSKERAEEKADIRIKQAHAQSESLVASAELRAEEMKEQALRESREEIGKAAILAAAKILREKTE